MTPSLTDRIEAMAEKAVGKVLPLSGNGVKQDILKQEILQLLKDVVEEITPERYGGTGTGQPAYFDDNKQGFNDAISEIEQNCKRVLGE